jgi:hypothetical protein
MLLPGSTPWRNHCYSFPVFLAETSVSFRIAPLDSSSLVLVETCQLVVSFHCAGSEFGDSQNWCHWQPFRELMVITPRAPSPLSWDPPLSVPAAVMHRAQWRSHHSSPVLWTSSSSWMSLPELAPRTKPNIPSGPDRAEQGLLAAFPGPFALLMNKEIPWVTC